MASDARFALLTAAMQGLTMDDYRKKLAAQRKGLNKVRTDTPARLDECKKTVVDLSSVDFEALERQKAEAQGTDDAAHIQQSLNAIRAQEGRRQRDMEYLRGRQKALEADVAACRTRRDTINREQFQGGTCPTCGQALPGNKLEASKAAFEREKSRRKGDAVDAANHATPPG